MTVHAALDARFRDAAAAEGLLDVAYDLADSPVGTLLVAATERGLCRISFDPEPDREVESLAREFGPRVLRSPRPLDTARRELDEYFEGVRRAFRLQLDLRPLPAFQQLVLGELARVPYGETATYGGLAARIGRPRAARAVGGALNRNPIPIVLPCHRVVGASGSLVGYAGGLDRKQTLLTLEGSDAGSRRKHGRPGRSDTQARDGQAQSMLW
jgi:methylated-DNA-[protein]-cysteine S-methyltransferase